MSTTEIDKISKECARLRSLLDLVAKEHQRAIEKKKSLLDQVAASADYPDTDTLIPQNINRPIFLRERDNLSLNEKLILRAEAAFECVDDYLKLHGAINSLKESQEKLKEATTAEIAHATIKQIFESIYGADAEYMDFVLCGEETRGLSRQNPTLGAVAVEALINNPNYFGMRHQEARAQSYKNILDTLKENAEYKTCLERYVALAARYPNPREAQKIIEPTVKQKTTEALKLLGEGRVKVVKGGTEKPSPTNETPDIMELLTNMSSYVLRIYFDQSQYTIHDFIKNILRPAIGLAHTHGRKKCDFALLSLDPTLFSAKEAQAFLDAVQAVETATFAAPVSTNDYRTRGPAIPPGALILCRS